MSRFYDTCCGDLTNWDYIRYQGALLAAIKGKRGQAFLADLFQALDDMPVKELIPKELEIQGQCCALGVLGKSRCLDLKEMGVFIKTAQLQGSYDILAAAFNIAPTLVQEVVTINDYDDNYPCPVSPAARYRRVLKWVADNLQP